MNARSGPRSSPRSRRVVKPRVAGGGQVPLCAQAIEEIFPPHGGSAKAAKVFGRHLAIDQDEAGSDQSLDQPDEADLRRVAGAGDAQLCFAGRA